jgi:hypothetical protein
MTTYLLRSTFADLQSLWGILERFSRLHARTHWAWRNSLQVLQLSRYLRNLSHPSCSFHHHLITRDVRVYWDFDRSIQSLKTSSRAHLRKLYNNEHENHLATVFWSWWQKLLTSMREGWRIVACILIPRVVQRNSYTELWRKGWWDTEKRLQLYRAETSNRSTTCNSIADWNQKSKHLNLKLKQTRNEFHTPLKEVSEFERTAPWPLTQPTSVNQQHKKILQKEKLIPKLRNRFERKEIDVKSVKESYTCLNVWSWISGGKWVNLRVGPSLSDTPANRSLSSPLFSGSFWIGGEPAETSPSLLFLVVEDIRGICNSNWIRRFYW